MRSLIKPLVTMCCLVPILMATAALAASGAAPGELARQILVEINLARTEPARYAGYLREMRPLYLGKAYRLPGSMGMVMTAEGVAALDEAVAFLSQQAPLPPLAWSEGLAEAAADLVRDQGATGELGHDGPRSGGTRERIEKHGIWGGQIAENISYGPSKARFVVIDLIVDDGVPGRGHRKNFFTRAFSVAGVACGPHTVYRKMCVIDFAGKYKERR